MVVQQPDIGGDAGVIKQVVRQLDNRLEHVVFDKVATDIALATARIAGKQAGAVMHRGDSAAQRAYRWGFHLVDHLHQEQQLTIAGARGGITVFGSDHTPVIGQFYLEAAVDHLVAIFDVFLL